jgi:hypothetical protein
MMSNPKLTSAVSAKGAESAKGPEQANRPALGKRLIARARSWFGKLTSADALLDRVPVFGAFLRLRVIWMLMIFVVGFAAGMTWQSYGGKSSASSERLRAMSLALSTARKSLDKLASDMSRLETQGLDMPQRRSAR